VRQEKIGQVKVEVKVKRQGGSYLCSLSSLLLFFSQPQPAFVFFLNLFLVFGGIFFAGNYFKTFTTTISHNRIGGIRLSWGPSGNRG
jgi:hypothetical protein